MATQDVTQQSGGTVGTTGMERRGTGTGTWLDQLWGGWPFGDWVWPFADTRLAVGEPIRVEEATENDQLVIRAELPGVDPDKDIDVSVHDSLLTIRAERREKKEDKSGQTHRSEFRYGRFTRQLRLPQGTSAEAISASYRDGILEVRLPVTGETPQGRQVPVERA